MGREIDERIVEMRFDNKQFEQGTKQTMSTLEKLKQALNFSKSGESLKALEKTVGNVDLSGIAKGIEVLENRFSALGIAGARVIENLTDSLMGLVSRGINFVTDSIVSGGIKRAMNIENAHFQLQSLLKDEEKVQSIMNSANKSVDGTAYSYDVAAKAGSMFAASGVAAGEKMDKALAAIANTTAAVNADYESMSMIFTQVSGQGRLMGDQLLQLSTRGMNAAALLVKYFQEVRGEAGMTEFEIRDMVSKGQIDFETFVDAMNYSYEGAAKRANETFTGAFSNIKAAFARIGAGFISPLIEQNSAVVDLFNAIRVKVNDVKKTLVFDEEIGNMDALSKRFTDSVLNISKSTAEWMENLDMTKPMKVFQSGINSAINTFKALGSVIKPIGRAFKNVFLSFSGDEVVSLAEKIEKLTEKLSLSDKNAKNLQDAFQGVFSVVKLLGDGFVRFIGILVPMSKPVNSLGEGFLELAGSMGRGLTGFTEWVRETPIVRAAFDILSKVVEKVTSSVGGFIDIIGKYGKKIWEMSGVERIFDQIGESLDSLDADKMFESFVGWIDKTKESLEDLTPGFVVSGLSSLFDAFERMGKVLSGIDWSDPIDGVSKFEAALGGMIGLVNKNPGLNGFVNNLGEFIENLKSTFSFNNVLDGMDNFKFRMDRFIEWIKNNVAPIFSGVSLGGIIGTGGGIAILYELNKLVKLFDKLGSGSIVGKFGEALGSVKSALDTWQKDMKADQIKKIATAVFILAGALTLLSLADTERLIPAAIALTAVASSLSLAFATFSKMMKMKNGGPTINDAIFQFADGLNTAMNKLSSAIMIKSIGKLVKDFATSIVEIVLAIVGVAVMYEKYPDSMDKAVKLVGGIAVGIVLVTAAMSLIGSKIGKGMNKFKKAASGAAMLCASVLLIVVAVEKLFSLTIPPDYGNRLYILGGLILSVAALALAAAAASKISGGNSVKQATTFIAFTSMLYITVKALEKLFGIVLPPDFGVKLGIMAGIFVALGGTMIAIGAASKLAGKSIKATGTILAMCAFIVTAVGALAVLSFFPGDKMLKGAVSLGLIFVALGVALTGAGKASSKGNYKSVLAMAVAVGTIAASLAVLSMIDWKKLTAATATLGAMLGVLAVDLNYAGKITSAEAVAAVIAMCVSVGVIAASLAILAFHDWDKLASAAAALSVTLVAFAGAMKLASDSSPDISSIGAFAAGLVALVAISVSINELAENPWDRLLAAGGSLSLTLVSLAAALKIASTANPNLMAIGGLVAATASLGVVAFSLYTLARECDPENLISVTIALGTLMLELSAVLTICGLIGTLGPAAYVGIGALDLILVSLLAILGIVGEISDKVNFVGGVEVFKLLGEALGGFGGAIISGLGGGIAEAIEKIGVSLSNFAKNVKPFFNAVADFGTAENVAAIAFLTAGITALTVAELLNGVASFVSGGDGLAKMGAQLSNFAKNAGVFLNTIKTLKPESADAANTLASMIFTMTKAELVSSVSSFISKLVGGGKTLADFGKELEAFATPISNYAKKVQGIDFSGVEGSARAAEIMMTLSKKLPSTGGLAQKIFGTKKSLNDFGKELNSFATPLVSYASKVKGVDFSAVEGSARAAEIMMNLSSKLPRSDGLAQKIFGEKKTLSQFGSELSTFGPLLARYAETISGVGPDSVKSSADATQILIDLSDKLGRDDNILEKLFGGGKTTLATFGVDLKNFGVSLAAYGTSIAGVSSKKMSEVTAELGKVLTFANSANGLDTSGMSGFAKALESLGKTGVDKFASTFKGSSRIVTNAVTSMINGVTNSVNAKSRDFYNLGTSSVTQYLNAFKNRYGEAQTVGSTLASRVTIGIQSQFYQFGTKGTSSITQYLNAFKNRYGEAQSIGLQLTTRILNGIQAQMGQFATKGTSSITQYLNAFKNRYGEAQNIGSTFAVRMLSGLQSRNSQFFSYGTTSVTQYLNAFKNMYGEAQTVGVNIAARLSNGIQSGVGKFSSFGSSSAYNYVVGIQSQYGNAGTAGNTLGAQANSGLQAYSGQFYGAGRNGAQGFINGFISSDMLNQATAAGRRIADAAYEAAKKALVVRSPSKKMSEVGNFAGQGFVNGILSQVTQSTTAGTTIGSSVVKGFSDAVTTVNKVLDSGVNLNPKITPTVDLSHLKKTGNEIAKVFDQSVQVSAGKAQTSVAAATSSKNAQKAEEQKNNKLANTGNKTFNFNQTNNSPKALSRTDIYRDSKNLLSQFKMGVY